MNKWMIQKCHFILSALKKNKLEPEYKSLKDILSLWVFSWIFLLFLSPHSKSIHIVLSLDKRLEKNFHTYVVKERTGTWLSSLLMKWYDSSGVLTLNTGVIQAYFKSLNFHFRWMGPYVLSFSSFYPCSPFLVLSSLPTLICLSVFLCPSPPSEIPIHKFLNKSILIISVFSGPHT